MTFLHDKGNKLAAKWGLLHKGGGENDTDTACPAAFVANRDLEVGRARWWGETKGRSAAGAVVVLAGLTRRAACFLRAGDLHAGERRLPRAPRPCRVSGGH